jgi:hypothetical protein
MSRSLCLAAAVAAIGLAWAGAGAAAGPNDLLPEDPAKPLVVRACTTCHQAPQIVAKRHTAEEWDQLVGVMVDRGARANEDEQQQIVDYLTKYFGPAAPAGAAKGGK